jgi:phosphopantothenoylcysteine decarboxylase/phosphopantothenate--cysteine ligase
MQNILMNKNILLGITGGIAAYKSAELIRLLIEQSANVRVVVTPDGLKFITALTLQTLAKHPVYTDMVTPEDPMVHISLAKWADLVLIAPATANFMGQLAHGLAPDLLTTLCLATKAPILIAPAMNQQMWLNVATQSNKDTLLARNVWLIGPNTGKQACGDTGLGRMQEPEVICNEVMQFFAPPLLKDKKILITAGPTQEAIDPIRYLSNRSSGKMGYALAQVAQQLGAKTTLISGPCHLSPPARVVTNHVTTAEEMHQAVMNAVKKVDIFISAAAVTDYRCAQLEHNKIKKSAAALKLDLIPNKDILMEVSKIKNPPFLVGFAAETENLAVHAKEKLLKKNLDMIIANEVGTSRNHGFDSDFNAVTVFTADQTFEFGSQSKLSLAKELLQLIAAQL